MANATLDEIFSDAYRIINEYSINGTVISATAPNEIDLKNRMYAPANAGYQELAKISKIPAVKSYSQHMPVNQLGSSAFDEVEHLATDLVYMAIGSQSFSFEVDGECTVTFQEDIAGVLTNITGTYITGTTITAFTGSFNVPSTVTSFTNFKGLLTLSSTSNTVYMTFSGSYPFVVRYRGMYAQKYATEAKVPALRPYVQYDVPTDLMEINEVLFSYDQRQYQPFTDYILKNGKFELPWGQKGQFDLHYWAFPDRITPSTAGTYEFRIGLDAQSALPYKIGGEAIMPDDSRIGTKLLNMYYALLESIQPTTTSNPVEVQNSMWGVR